MTLFSCIKIFLHEVKLLFSEQSFNGKMVWEVATFACLGMEYLLCSIILSGKPSTLAGIRFLDLLSEDEMAFDKIFCIAFQLLDAQWLAKHASYMEFNVWNFYLLCTLTCKPNNSQLIIRCSWISKSSFSGCSQVNKNTTWAWTCIGRHFMYTRFASI